jgi:hypothetical protein
MDRGFMAGTTADSGAISIADMNFAEGDKGKNYQIGEQRA